MRISLLISIFFLVFAASLNAQTSNHSHSNNLSLWGDVPQIPDDVFTFSYGTNEKDTTFELIYCHDENGLHKHKRIDIHWENGIPRHGIITVCSQQQHNINYFPAAFNPQKGTAISIMVGPKVMNDEMELYAKYPVIVAIMDVLTGSMVYNTLRNPVDAETYQFIPDTTIAHIEPGQTEPAGFFKSRATEMPTASTRPDIVRYSHLSSGLYFMIIMDNSSKEIMFLKTFRKGIK